MEEKEVVGEGEGAKMGLEGVANGVVRDGGGSGAVGEGA